MNFNKEKLFDAINKILKNAQSLIEDAKFLKEHGRFPRAYTLFQLAIEETAKASITFNFLLFDNIEDSTKQKSFLKEFRNHEKKIIRSIDADFIVALNMDDKRMQKIFIKQIKYQLDNISNINDAKNHSLYVSYINKEFLMPSEIINKEKVEQIEITADFRLYITMNKLKICIDEFDGILKASRNVDTEKIFNETVEELKKIIYD